jgi:DNA-binding transcriptional MerR regulator
MSEPATKKDIIPEKLFYKIGEVSSIAEVEPYVLRYWESEFPFLKPRKNKAGQRIYTKKNLEMILQIKNLLYKEKYTIAGVKRKFHESSLKKKSVPIETIVHVRKRLKKILETLK